ncbi:MAG: branched-chain amino acid ABC transporter permease [Deltaproteobacteria bacterium]|nr:branched-chain amino acid ABC transporter permease [Deltaproteobacteria bacterium]MBW1924418.1 branched-chain amino acid ABC transporter permease [Deltaproteobacteria bacterium]MBW1948256.1 branched-chain amino acid ABC transporter permease [Deltaproteobacteria bacterium]MBW2007832.1 branched-chain amino acid ABC transporter permease [Deltaproteobacteria bacterium]RLB40754.1 MAG: branched-chain amino acid ABC transporter permease [Deltaproteobacteria bacterium]
MTIFLQYAISGLMVGAIYGLVAVGFVIIVKSSEVFNFAQGELLILGAFVCWALIFQLKLPPWLAVAGTLAFAGLFGMVVERFPLRPMIGQPLFAIIMVTLAVGICLRGFLTAIWGGMSWRVFKPPLLPPEPVRVGKLLLPQQHIYGFFIAVVVVLVLSLFFKYTRAGLAMRIVAEDHKVAQAMGISVRRVFRNSWAMSAILAAIGGILLGSINGINIPLANIGIKAIPAALIGGLQSIPGAVVGGLLIGLLEGLSSGYIGHGVQDVVAYIVMIVVLIFWPHGFFGLETIERV